MILPKGAASRWDRATNVPSLTTGVVRQFFPLPAITPKVLHIDEARGGVKPKDVQSDEVRSDGDAPVRRQRRRREDFPWRRPLSQLPDRRGFRSAAVVVPHSLPRVVDYLVLFGTRCSSSKARVGSRRAHPQQPRHIGSAPPVPLCSDILEDE